MSVDLQMKKLILSFFFFLTANAMAQYNIENVTFQSQGKQLVGKLFLPATKIKGTFTIFGPVAFAKEQSPIQYATRLAKEGYITLIFDPRYYGQSEGEPRRFESRKAKVEDIIASVDFLLTRKEVNPQKLYALGICQGTNWVVEAATLDKRIQKVALVASHLLTPETAHNYCGGQEGVINKLERAKLAKQKFEKTGEVDYIHIVQENSDDKAALLLIKPIADWYLPWGNHAPYFAFRGEWENKITQMSELDIWGHDVIPFIEKLQQPVLMIHSDKAATGSDIPKRLFAKIPSQNKQLVWFAENQVQFQFYEDCVTIDKAVFELKTWAN
jgi:dienelactone hydrolase